MLRLYLMRRPAYSRQTPLFEKPSFVLAIIALLLLHIVVLGLLWTGLRRPRAIPAIATGFGAVILAVVGYQTGLLTGRTEASQLPSPSSLPSASNRQCREILRVLTENRIIREPTGGDRLVVARAAWEQVPESVRDQIVACAEELRPASAAGNPLEVVQQ